MPMNIAIVSDAWFPQVNGVVNSLNRTRQELERLGHSVHVIGPDRFRTVACPTYPEIRLSLFPGMKLRALLREIRPDAIHIATEGPLGLAARSWCLKNDFPFTTSFHTQFPEYVWLRSRVPLALTYRLMRWFHGKAATVMVATPTLHERLTHWGFRNLGYWSRGVDTDLFRPRDKSFLDLPRPVFLYMGRVAIEKNIEAFLMPELPGSKVVVGGGPDLDRLRKKYPAAHFTGYKRDDELARYAASADVFVFPSRTDTFGLVVIEALACGVPVAAFPVQGPIDIIQNGITGFLSEDLREAALNALDVDPQRCREEALKYTWEASTRQFLGHIEAGRPRPSDAVRGTATTTDARSVGAR
jgi:glycosyltransferase involved in cell wall biosynthesis